MQFHFHANQSHFHKNGFAPRLALKQRHKGIRKWLIDFPEAHLFRINRSQNLGDYKYLQFS